MTVLKKADLLVRGSGTNFIRLDSSDRRRSAEAVGHGPQEYGEGHGPHLFCSPYVGKFSISVQMPGKTDT